MVARGVLMTVNRSVVFPACVAVSEANERDGAPVRTQVKRLRQQQLEIVRAQVADQRRIGGENRVGELALGLLQLRHLLLDRVLRDEAVGEDVPALADAVRAIDGLRFRGGGSPPVEGGNVLRGGGGSNETARVL